FRVKQLFSLFSDRISGETLLTRRRVCRCSVSVVAHYREFSGSDKHKFQIIYRSLKLTSLRLF
ncbi:hypothetical protein QEG60_003644, partial [Pluralibacter gergoviae]